jgi:2-dehydro-3-deoxygluconokinase
VSSALVVTFGELMLRLSPPGSERFLQSPVLSATFGGGEANVAVSLAQFGLHSRFVSCLPANPIGDAAIRTLRAEGIDVGSIRRSGSRVGIYYAENGASQRPSTVVYDRAHSALSEMRADEIDWSAVLAGAAWFHFTGITPALSDHAASATAAAIATARAAGARVSVDLNFRRKLWSEARAREVMTPLVRNVDLVIANEEDLQSVLGVEVRGADVTAGELDVSAFEGAARQTASDFSVGRVAITLRESCSASDNGWSALLWDAGSGVLHRSQFYDIHIVDRIGGGDSFAAGLIYGLVTNRAPADALRFAVAASALKHTIPGDFNRVTVDEVDRLAAGDGSGRVQR